ncbi:MAG: hypothetical protein IK123_10585 [Lachnospiraceae bacterium]|nr:hypothetical protein [Lachnospiraceae bacterium]
MNKMLSQQEIDSIVEALVALKDYADNNTISTDLLNGQVVLTQTEIDKLINSLNTVKDLPMQKPGVNVSLSQSEIDSLIDALDSIREYGQLDALNVEMLSNQSVLSQNEIDVLIGKLLSFKGE